MSDEDRMVKLCAFVARLPEPRRPPIVVPDELCATAEQVFRHLDPAAVPEVAHVLEWLVTHHPEVIAAVGDVDRTLIWDALDRTPLENLAIAEGLAQDEETLRAAMRQVA